MLVYLTVLLGIYIYECVTKQKEQEDLKQFEESLFLFYVDRFITHIHTGNVQLGLKHFKDKIKIYVTLLCSFYRIVQGCLRQSKKKIIIK